MMQHPVTPRPKTPRAVRGWYFFDWSSQPFSTLLLTFIFAPFFVEVVGDATRAQTLWGAGLAVAGGMIALLAPILGAFADSTGRRMPWIVGFSALYVMATSVLWWAVPGADDRTILWTLLAFGSGMLAMEFATVFTNAQLPDLVPRTEVGRISGSGFAFGYLGGLIALGMMLVFFVEQPDGRTLLGLPPGLGLLDANAREGTRAVGPLCALWYSVFMVPFFVWVKEPVRTHAWPHARRGAKQRSGLSQALTDLGRTLRGLRQRRSLARYLGASMLYRDGLNGIYGFGGIYAVGVLGWSITQIGVFGILGAISATVFAWLGGRADRRHGPRPVILGCGAVLVGVCVIIGGIGADSLFGHPLPPGSILPDTAFYLCGIAIGGAGAAMQSASRTMMVRHSHDGRATEAFGLYALSGKATAFLAPGLVAWATLATGTQTAGLIPLVILMLAGLALMVGVSPEGDPA